MLICKNCYLMDRPEDTDDPLSEWEEADHVYAQCEICLHSRLCAELD
jgi:hypothetical protein